MSWTSGFFNSIENDRLYNADQMSGIFEGLITPGVYASIGNKLAVQPNNNMTIQISTGRGWFGGRWVNNDTEHLMTLEESDETLNRYAAICIRTDLGIEIRKSEPYIKYSTFASTPTKPTMERTETVKEYCLAYVYIAAKTKTITAAMIEDTRSDTELCGWVTGLIEQIDGSTLFKQLEGIFKEWFDGLNNYLDENVETKLTQDMLEVKTTAPFKRIAHIDGLGWNSQPDGTYIQTVAVEGVTSSNDIFVSPKSEYEQEYESRGYEAIAQGEGTVTFMTKSPADINMDIKIIVMNDYVTLEV